MSDIVRQMRLRQQQLKKELKEIDDEKRRRAFRCLADAIEQERRMPGSQDLRGALRAAKMFRRRGCI